MRAFTEESQEDARLEKRVNHIGKRLKTGRELRMTTQTGDYNMDYIILDLGSNVNIINRKNGKVWDNQD